jgi:class 3 adenylate cyclase
MITVEAPPLERKLVAILAADVEGYSRLMHDDEEAALATLTAHRAIIDERIEAGRGEISGTAGDSVLAQFASVVDSVRCAVSIQQALYKANQQLAEDRRMLLRIGINVGDVMLKDGGIFGDGVNVAARLEGIAQPGGICVTRGVRDHLRDRMDYNFEDLGEHKVKNIARSVRVFRVIFDPEGTTELGSVETERSIEQTSDTGPSLVTEDKTRDDKADEVELIFWQSLQDSEDPAEYRAYLERFPEGAFVDLARIRLAGFAESGRMAAADPVELEFWTSVKDADDRAMLEAYLEKYPDGEFRRLAEIRLAEATKEKVSVEGPEAS